MTRDELGERILREVLKREAAVKRRPKPEKWQRWLMNADADEREYGPRYSSYEWFGDLSDANRVRLLRVLYALEDAGMLVPVKSENGRLQHVRLTAAGRKAAMKLKAGKAEPDLSAEVDAAIVDAESALPRGE